MDDAALLGRVFPNAPADAIGRALQQGSVEIVAEGGVLTPLADSIYVITDGLLAVKMPARRRLLAYLVKGQYVGHDAVVGRQARATVEAMREARVLCIPGPASRPLLDSRPPAD